MKKIFYLLAVIMMCSAVSCEKENGDDDPVAATFLYFGAWRDTTLAQIELQNGNVVSTLEHGVFSGFPEQGILGIDYNSATGDIYLTLERDLGKIYKRTASGDLVTLFDETDGVDDPSAIFYNSSNGKLYWMNTGTAEIWVGNVDGTGTPVSLFGTTMIDATGYGMEVDTRNNKIYFTNWDEIYVGNLNGSGTPTILYGFRTDTIVSPSSIELDVDNNRIYWTDESSDVVGVANLDGTGNFQILFDNATDGVDRSDGLAIDKVTNKIYWTETDSERIRVGNLDGSGTPQTLLSSIESYILRLR